MNKYFPYVLVTLGFLLNGCSTTKTVSVAEYNELKQRVDQYHFQNQKLTNTVAFIVDRTNEDTCHLADLIAAVFDRIENIDERLKEVDFEINEEAGAPYMVLRTNNVVIPFESYECVPSRNTLEKLRSYLAEAKSNPPRSFKLVNYSNEKVKVLIHHVSDNEVTMHKWISLEPNSDYRYAQTILGGDVLYVYGETKRGVISKGRDKYIFKRGKRIPLQKIQKHKKTLEFS